MLALLILLFGAAACRLGCRSLSYTSHYQYQ
jgi:hypothetical protein